MEDILLPAIGLGIAWLASGHIAENLTDVTLEYLESQHEPSDDDTTDDE